MKKVIKILIVVFLLAALATCLYFALKKDEIKKRVYYQYFDTVATLYDFSGDSEEKFSSNADAFKNEIATCHKLFDIYNSYKDEGIVNIKDINDGAGGEPIKVDGRIIELLDFSKKMYEKTDGAVNIAMGAVLRIWHECREDKENPRIPTEDELLAASEHCDINCIEIDKEKSTVRLTDPKMSLDVGAIAKGFAVDLAAKLLRSRGAMSYAIDIGGNLYAIGTRADGSPFKTGVQNPDGGDYSAYIDVADGAVATSGDYQRYYIVDGKTYHHIINGETLYPAYYHRSVTVYSDSAAVSDALSTALFNTADYDVARQIISNVGEVREVIFIEPDGRVEKIRP